MRRAARVDANQKEIVEALRSYGCSVRPTHTVGQGFPDIVVGYDGFNYLFEIKDGSKVPSKRRLTEDEQQFFDGWLGHVRVVKNSQEAINYIESTFHKEQRTYNEKPVISMVKHIESRGLFYIGIDELARVSGQTERQVKNMLRYFTNSYRLDWHDDGDSVRFFSID